MPADRFSIRLIAPGMADVDLMLALEGVQKAAEYGVGLKEWADGGHIYLVMKEIARTEGAAALRAIEDASRSGDPRAQLAAAETLLRSAYEKYLSHAEAPSGKADLQDAAGTLVVGRASHVDAYGEAAVVALLLAELAVIQDNPSMMITWLDRARDQIARHGEEGKRRLVGSSSPSRAQRVATVYAVGLTGWWGVLGMRNLVKARRVFAERHQKLEQTYTVVRGLPAAGPGF